MSDEPTGPTNAMVAQKATATIRDLLGKMGPEMAKALPKHISPERMARMAMTTVLRSPALLACDARSLVGAVLQASQLQLELDSNLGLVWLVPYKGQVQLQLGYKGLIALAYRSGHVANVEARVVRKGDEFQFEYGSKPRILHRPVLVDAFNPAKAGENVIALYAIVTMRSGVTHSEVMSRAEIEAVRATSKTTKAETPWNTSWEEMAKKTVTRRVLKMIPSSTATGLGTAVALDEKAEQGISQGLDMLAAPVLDVDSFILTGEQSMLTPTEAAKAKLDKLAGTKTAKTNGKKPETAGVCKSCGAEEDLLNGLCITCSAREPGQEG